MLYYFHMTRVYRLEFVLTTITLLAICGLVFDQFRSISRTYSLDGVRQIYHTNISGQIDILQSIPFDRKPHLVIHVGPSKTATTSLQTSLTQFQDYLAADNYTYSGRYYSPFNDERGNLHLNPKVSPLLKETTDMLKKRKCSLNPRSLCCSSFKTMLDEYKDRGQNVIISEEAINHIWVRPTDYVAVQEALQDEWRVTVVVGYRRFYEWLPSYKYQQDRLDHKVPWKTEWPGQGGRPLEGLFPNYFRHWRQLFSYTDSALNNIGVTFPVKLLNLHDETSVRSNFLCNIVPDAPTSCKESLDRDQRGAETTINTRSETSSFFYDTIAIAAAQTALVDVNKWRRGEVVKAIQIHNEEVLNCTVLDLELDCPSEQQLKEFLQLSLDLEKNLMPALFSTGEVEHRAAFYRKVEAKAFCWVDAEAVLNSERWKDFFSHFSLKQ